MTDHSTILGGVITKKENYHSDFEVIIGSEIKTEFGDIIGLYLNCDIKSNNFFEVIEEIKSQGGFSVLAHPYRQYLFPETIINYVDFVEVFNARSTTLENKKSQILVEKFSKGITAGSDAHSSFEIGNGVCNVNLSLSTAVLEQMSFEGKVSNYYLSHGISYISELIKKLIP